MSKSVEEWAKECKHIRLDWKPADDSSKLCVNCARAYAAEQRREAFEQAARLVSGLTFPSGFAGTVHYPRISGIIAARIRALAGEEQS